MNYPSISARYFWNWLRKDLDSSLTGCRNNEDLIAASILSNPSSAGLSLSRAVHGNGYQVQKLFEEHMSSTEPRGCGGDKECTFRHIPLSSTFTPKICSPMCLAKHSLDSWLKWDLFRLNQMEIEWSGQMQPDKVIKMSFNWKRKAFSFFFFLQKLHSYSLWQVSRTCAAAFVHRDVMHTSGPHSHYPARSI